MKERLEILILRELDSLGDNKNLVLAVSGGIDSIVLLEIINNLISAKKLNIAVAHFNHGLREESLAEQKFVENYCKTLNIKCFVGKADKFDGSENMEAWARNKRYDFLEQVRIKVKADFVLTAHHKNDLAETVLMRILSGRAALSIGGIKKLDYIKRLFRPLLTVTKDEIEKYAENKKIKYVYDSSNSNLEITRNRIRKEIIPILENKINPGLIDTLCLLSRRINIDEESIWDLVNRIYLEEKNSNSWEFYVKNPMYIRWRLLKLELERQIGTNKVGYYSLLRLSEILDTDEGNVKTVELGWDVYCRFSRKGMLEFVSKSSSSG